MREILKAFYSAMSVFANGKEVASVGEAIESLLDDVAKVKGSVD
jgi:hypothetical protein